MISTNIFLLWPLTQLILYYTVHMFLRPPIRMLGSGLIHATLIPLPECLLN